MLLFIVGVCVALFFAFGFVIGTISEEKRVGRVSSYTFTLAREIEALATSLNRVRQEERMPIVKYVEMKSAPEEDE